MSIQKRLKDLGAVTAIMKSATGMDKKVAEKYLASAVAAKKLSKEQAALASTMLKTSTAEGATATAASSLSLAFKGLWATIAAHPLIAVTAAIAGLALAVGKYKEYVKESYREIINDGQKAEDEAKASREAFSDMSEVYEAYKLGTKTKEDLTEVTDRFIESLGLERWQVQGLADDYSNLLDVMGKYRLKKLADDRGDLLKAVKAAKDLAVEDPRQVGSTATLFTALRGAYDTYNTPEQLELLDFLISQIQSNPKGGLASKLDLNRDKDGNYVLSFKGDFKGAEGLVRLVETAKAVKDELYEIASDKGIGDSLYENWVWNYADNIENVLGEFAGNITSAEQNLSENIAETYLVQRGKIPETVEQYYTLRDTLIELTSANESFAGSAKDAADAVDRVLSGYSFSKEFASGINRFKHELSGAEKEVQDAVDKILKSGEELTDGQAEDFVKWAKSLGYSADEVKGYLTRMASEMESAAKTDITIKNISGLATLRDELKKTEEAFEEYNKILEGGDRGDTANKMAEAYQKAIDDINKGRIDTKAVWGAAKLLFSDEQLAAWGYDLNRIAAELRGPMMEALFGKGAEGDDTDIGVKFANYIREHASELGDAIKLIDQGSGKFTFIYDSLSKLAKNLGMSEDALSGLLDALDAYGVSSVRSTEETKQLADAYKEIYAAFSNISSASDRTTKSIREFVKQMHDDGMTEPEILNVLKTLSESGVIGQSVDSLNDIIRQTIEELEGVDKTNPNPTIEANTAPAHSAIDALVARLNALSQSEYHTTLYIDKVAQDVEEGEGYASGTRDAKAGRALVNEKGPELISDNGVAYIANGGKPGFVNLGEGAVVFNAEDTKQIFSRGYSNIPVRAYANGTAGVTDRAGLRERLINGGKTAALDGGTQRCPACGSKIKTGLTGTCPWCKAKLVNGELPGQPGQSSNSGSNSGSSAYVGCPNCGYSIYRNYTGTCPKCGVQLKNGVVVSSAGATGGTLTGSGNYQSCPNCGGQIQRWLTGSCPHCGAALTNGRLSGTYSPTGASQTFAGANSFVTTPIDVYTPNHTQSSNDGGSSGYSGAGGGAADYASQSEPQKVDWIAVAINRIQKAVAALEKVASSGFKKLSTRLKAAREEVNGLTQEIKKNESGYERYLEEAASVGLDEDIAELVRNGTIDISEYDDETRKLIDSYSEWYEKALDCKYAVEELHQEIADLYADMFNATQTDYENKLSQIEHGANMVGKQIEYAKLNGYMDTAKYYEQLMDNERQQITTLSNELNDLQAAFEQALRSGEIEEYSEAWYDMQASINAVEEAIADANIQLVEFGQTMKQEIIDMHLSAFSTLQTGYENLLGEIEHSASMIGKSMEYAQTAGYANTSGYYNQLIENRQSSLSMMEEELERLRAAFDRAMATGEIEEGSDEFWQMRAAIRAVEESIADAYVQIEQYQKTLKEDLAALYMNAFNETQSYYSNQLSQLEHEAELAGKVMELAKANGYMESEAYYQKLSDAEKRNIQTLSNELADLKTAFSTAMDRGEIEEYSDEYWSMKSAINSVENALADANVKLAQYAKTMRSIEWDAFDYAMNRFGQLTQESGFLISLMSNDKLFDDDGKFASKGQATMGLRVMQYNAYMEQADRYAQELRRIEAELANNPADTELITRKEALLKLQQQSIQAAESEKDAIRDLVQEGINLELSALQELINTYTDSLDRAKDLYAYQKKISEKTADVAKIQKQLSAYQGDNSEENRARIQQLQESLRKAQESLEETEYEQNIAEQKKLLNELYDSYEEYMNGRLDDLDALVAEMTDGVNANIDEIQEEIRSSAEQVGYTITDGLYGIFQNGVFAYYDRFSDSLTSVGQYLNSIFDTVSKIAQAADSVLMPGAAAQTESHYDPHDETVQTPFSGTSIPTESLPKPHDTIAEMPDEPVLPNAQTHTDTPDTDGLFDDNDTPAASQAASGIKRDKNGTTYATLFRDRAKKLDVYIEQYNDDPSNGLKRNILAQNVLLALTDAVEAGIDTGDPVQAMLAENGGMHTLDIWDYLISRVTDGAYRNNPFKGFSSGGLADYTGVAILHGTKEHPELVLNADDTARFLEAAKLMRDTPILSAVREFSTTLPSLRGDAPAGDVIVNLGGISIDHVLDYNEMITQLRNDPKFEKMIGVMTFGRMKGNSSFGAKNRIHFDS